MKKIDLRVIKTKNKLYEALLLLLKENSFENIKVLDICNKANINRSTFYDHFTDKYDILNSLLNDLQKEFKNNLTNIKDHSNIKLYFLELVKFLLNHFKTNIDTYSSIVKYNNNSISIYMLINVISDDLNEIIDKYWKNNVKVPNKVFISYYVPAIISVCCEYLYNTDKYTEDDIIKYLDKLIKI